MAITEGCPRLPGVSRSMDRISSRLDVMNEAIARLAEGLRPVLHPEPTSKPCVNGPTPRSPACELVRALEDRADRLDENIMQVQELFNRLEV